MGQEVTVPLRSCQANGRKRGSAVRYHHFRSCAPPLEASAVGMDLDALRFYVGMPTTPEMKRFLVPGLILAISVMNNWPGRSNPFLARHTVADIRPGRSVIRGSGPADVSPHMRAIQVAGQVDRLASVRPCLVELVLQGVSDGEQRGAESLASDVARVHIERSQGEPLGLGVLTEGMQIVGDLGSEIGLVKVAQPYGLGSPPVELLKTFSARRRTREQDPASLYSA